MKKEYLLLIFIIFIAAFLRFWNLGQNPLGIHADEADTGYTALSLIETGRDPYGNFLPLQFQNQALNYRPPLYAYLVIPSIKVFGLTPFSERLPSATYGVITVFLIFLITRNLFSSLRVAYFSAFLMAVNPWSIQVSRVGLEVMLSLLFVLVGVYLFLKAKNNYFYILSAISFGLSIFTYHAPKVFLPLFLVALIIYKCKLGKILFLKKQLFIFFLILSLFYLTMFKLAIFDKGTSEFQIVGIFSAGNPAGTVFRETYLTRAPLEISSLFHNKTLYYLKQFKDRYFSPFSINFLFLNGESSFDKGVANHGEFYLFELPFFFLGIYFLINKRRRLAFFLLSWMLIGAIPQGITLVGSAVYRDINLLPVPVMFTSFGIVGFFDWLKKKDARSCFWLKTALVLVSLCFISSYLFTLYFDYPVYSADSWNMGPIKTLSYAVQNQDKYNNIFIDGSSDWPILYAFHNKISPRRFQEAVLNKIDFNNDKGTIKIGKFYFGNFLIDEKSSSPSAFFPKNSLLIVPGNIFKKSPYIFSATAPDGIHINNKIFEIR